MLDFSPFLVFLAVVAAAVVLRRRINDPASPLGRWWDRYVRSWYDRHVRSWLSLGFKIILFLTVIIWFAVYLSAPEKDRGSLGDLIDRFNHPEGKAPSGKDKAGREKALEDGSRHAPAAVPATPSEPGAGPAPPVRR